MVLRGAISGFGEVAARAHIPGWRTRANVSIAAIHDPVAARRHQAINLVKNARVYDDLELMLDGEALDFVDIASPPAFHADTASAALAAGAHVLIEKPLCLDLEAFDRLAASAVAKSRLLMCVHNWKHAPALRRARELLSESRIGELREIAMTRLRTEPAGAGGSVGLSGERWRLDARTGGGILIDHGWHVFYLMQWLMGAVPESVAAHLDYPASSTVDEAAQINLSFGDGRTGAVELSWHAPMRRTSTVIVGSAGRLEIDDNRIILTDRAGRIEDLSVADAPDDSYHPAWFAGVTQEFETALAEGANGPICRGNQVEARSALAIIEAARESSARGGTPIKLANEP
jgi:predicted dehydrogenase